MNSTSTIWRYIKLAFKEPSSRRKAGEKSDFGVTLYAIYVVFSQWLRVLHRIRATMSETIASRKCSGNNWTVTPRHPSVAYASSFQVVLRVSLWKSTEQKRLHLGNTSWSHEAMLMKLFIQNTPWQEVRNPSMMTVKDTNWCEVFLWLWTQICWRTSIVI